MAKRIGVGQFLAWDGGCLFIGRHDKPVPEHAHQAIQLLFASEGDHRVRASEADPWVSNTITGIPTRQPHSIDITSSPFGAVILIEPETRVGRAIMQRHLNGGIAEVGNAECRDITRLLFEQWLAGNKDEVVQLARILVSTVAAGVEPAVVTDPRILSAIDFINLHLDRPLTLNAVAAHACLSPSRFRHLFSEQTGMGLRPYILWRRFLLTWELVMKGATLSEVAHAAGFADAAHLSRTSKRTFGFSPSALQIVADVNAT